MPRRTIIAHLLLVCLLAVNTVMAFQPVHASKTTNTCQWLHPSQAADLERVAYDLMKEALEQQRAQMNLFDDTTRSGNGPVAWCRRRLWPFGKQQKNLRP